MNEKSDPSCSHGFKSNNHQKQTLEYDKSMPSTTDDPQAIKSRSSHQMSVEKYYQDVPSVIILSDKRRVERQTDDRIGDKKSQECVENVSSITDRQILDYQTDDTKNGNNVLTVVDVLDKQIDVIQDDDGINSHQDQIPEYDENIPTIKNNIQITKPTELVDNKIGRQETFQDYIKDVLSLTEVLQVQQVFEVQADIENDSDRQAPFQKFNKSVLSVIKVLDKQIVEHQIDDITCGNESQSLDENVSSISDAVKNQIFEPRANDRISGHCGHQAQLQENEKDVPQNIVVSGSQVETLTPKPFRLVSTLSNKEIVKKYQTLQQRRESPSISLRSTATQLRILSNLPSPMSINIAPNQPQPLFLLALSKLNESAISFALNSLDSSLSRAVIVSNRPISPELTPPRSLGSAPPSYSFVLRQMAVRRRPRICAGFVPSPSFVQHAPPPTYTASFDVYLDNLPPPPTRVYNFGFAPMLVVCPDCGFTGMTQVTSKVTLCTHLCAFTLCIMCCWICVPLPYVMRSCKEVYHYCRNCRSFLGTYCPTNPENVTIR